MEKKHEHLEMIQGVINRMANNSFMLKGWAVTLLAGLFALSSKEADKLYFLIAYVPIIVFWWLDAFYLQKERLYVALYDFVRKLPEDKIDYDMRVTCEKFSSNKNRYLNCLFSKTEVGFYIPTALLTAGVIFLTCL